MGCFSVPKLSKELIQTPRKTVKLSEQPQCDLLETWRRAFPVFEHVQLTSHSILTCTLKLSNWNQGGRRVWPEALTVLSLLVFFFKLPTFYLAARMFVQFWGSIPFLNYCSLSRNFACIEPSLGFECILYFSSF